jgi:hypothetical protein
MLYRRTATPGYTIGRQSGNEWPDPGRRTLAALASVIRGELARYDLAPSGPGLAGAGPVSATSVEEDDAILAALESVGTLMGDYVGDNPAGADGGDEGGKGGKGGEGGKAGAGPGLAWIPARPELMGCFVRKWASGDAAAGGGGHGVGGGGGGSGGGGTSAGAGGGVGGGVDSLLAALSIACTPPSRAQSDVIFRHLTWRRACEGPKLRKMTSFFFI